MDANLHGALKKVAEALHRAIAESDDVEKALAAVKEAGFQAFLVLEVTVALARPGADDDEADVRSTKEAEADGSSETRESANIVLRIPAGDAATEPSADGDALTSHIAPDDRDFLRSIRIRLDD